MKRVNKKETPSFTKENLKVSAVDRLVEANQGNAEEISNEELKQYKSGKLQKIPAWLKVIVVKFWFAGAICFFFLWGLGIVIQEQWSLILVLGFGGGVVADLLTNNFLRFLESSDHEFYPYMMFTEKKFYTLFANIVYGIICTLCVVEIYELINTILVNLNPSKYIVDGVTTVPLGVGPILYGVFYTTVDLAFVGIKDLIKKLFFKKKLEEEIY